MANQAALARLARIKARARPASIRFDLHPAHMRRVAADARIEAIDAYHARRNGVVF